MFSDDGSVGDASSSSSSMASGVQQPHHGGEQRYGLEEMEMRKERPWDLPTFQKFRYLKASDQWTHAFPGWLIRTHGKKRTRLFHPVHRNTPKVNEMEINRTTVIFLEDGTRIIKHDQWASAQQVPEEVKGKQWRGFTFFKLKSMARGQQAGIPEGDENGDEVEDTREIQMGSSSKGKGPPSTGAKGYRIEDSISGGKGPGSSSQQPPKSERENHQKELSPQKPIKRVLPQRDLAVGVMVMMMFLKVRWYLVMKLKMMMGVLNLFMIRFPHGMFNLNPLHSMLCGMVQKISLLFALCAWQRWSALTRRRASNPRRTRWTMMASCHVTRKLKIQADTEIAKDTVTTMGVNLTENALVELAKERGVPLETMRALSEGQPVAKGSASTSASSEARKLDVSSMVSTPAAKPVQLNPAPSTSAASLPV